MIYDLRAREKKASSFYVNKTIRQSLDCL